MIVTPLVASTFCSDGGAMFGLVPKPLWSKLIPANERNGIRQNANCLLVELADGRRGLVDTGCGPAEGFTEKELAIHDLSPGWPLLEALSRLGLTEQEIDFVVLTHLHWDHAGGTRHGAEGEAQRLTFTKADHFVHKVEWEAATSGDPLLYHSYPPSVIEPLRTIEGTRLHLVTDETTEVLPGILLARTGGHTRGHSAVVIEAEDLTLNHPDAARFPGARRLVFAADVCPPQHHLRMVFQSAYDTSPLDTRAWKREHLTRIAEAGDLLLFDHDPDAFGATLRPDPRKEFVVEQILPVTA